MTPERQHTHACCATGCQKQVPRNLLMCMTHWRMVPAPVQREVLASWRLWCRHGDDKSAETHRAAVAQAVAAVQAKQVRKIASGSGGTASLFEV